MILRTPAMISGQPTVLWSSIQPAAIGGRAAARLRGTLVTLAAAARSRGETTAITYELRSGASIADSRLRATRHTIARARLGINAAATSSTWAGMWLNTIVRINPSRLATRAATNAENAEHTPV